MTPSAPTLGILVTAPPDTREFAAFLSTAEENLTSGRRVFAYLLHDAVEGIDLPLLQSLKDQGLVLHACALAATQRNIPNSDLAVFSGLVTLGELIARCDRFLTFSPEDPS